MHIALYQPDIPQNTGTLLRMAACLGVFVDIIGPAGFDLSDRAFRRAGLDYLDKARFALHDDFDAFTAKRLAREKRPVVLATTKAGKSYLAHEFTTDEVILFGSESAGVPPHVHELIQNRVKVPMRPDTRSLNLAVCAAMITGEALRQTQSFPR